MANPNPKPKQPRGHEYAPNMRRAFYEGLVRHARDKGMTLTEMCATWWEEDWKAAAAAFAKFLPREVKGDMRVTNLEDLLRSVADLPAAGHTRMEGEPRPVRH